MHHSEVSFRDEYISLLCRIRQKIAVNQKRNVFLVNEKFGNQNL